MISSLIRRRVVQPILRALTPAVALLGAAAVLGPDLARAEAAPPQKPDDAVVFGAVLPLSGPLAPFGQLAEAALRLGEADVNAAGGIAGRPLRVIVADSRGQPGVALVQAAQLVDKQGAVALLGPITSTDARPIAVKLALRRRVPMIAIGATARGLEALGGSGLIFRVMPGDAHQAVALANYATMQGKTLLSCLFMRNGYGANMAQTFTLWAQQRQVQNGACLPYTAETDWTQTLTQLSEQPGEALMVVGAAPDGLGMLTAIAGGSHERLLLLTEGFKSPQLLTGIPADKQALIAIAAAHVDEETEAYRHVMSRLQARMGGQAPIVPLLAAASYDAVVSAALGFSLRASEGGGGDTAQLASAAVAGDGTRALGAATGDDPATLSIGEALVAANGPPGPKFTPLDLAPALAAAAAGIDIDYDGATGPIDYDAQGEPVSLIGIWRLRDQAFVLERVFRSYRASQ